MLVKTATAPQQISFPIKHILPWTLFGGLICLVALYFITTEQGAISVFNGSMIHEFVHDGRHLLGFPCH